MPRAKSLMYAITKTSDLVTVSAPTPPGPVSKTNLVDTDSRAVWHSARDDFNMSPSSGWTVEASDTQ